MSSSRVHGNSVVYTFGAITDGEFLKRSGTTFVSASGVLVSDGDKGDVTVSAGGTVWTIDNNAVTFAKMQAVSADVLLGNDSAGTAVQEIACTAFARSILDDANEATFKATVNLEIGVDVQAFDATLAALAAYNTNGLVAQTAADTFAGRTLTGTANQITVSNGDGVAGNPTLSLPSDVLIPTVLTVPNSGLHVLDTDASHDLIITPGSNLSADRILTITTGDAARTLTISGNATVSQDYSSSGSPQFTAIELGHASDTTITRSSAGRIAVEGKVAYLAGGDNVAVVDGGTGLTSATAYAVLCGGTTSTSAFQSVSGVGTAGQVLTSNGAGALPTWQGAGAAGWTRISTATASASATVDFTLPAGYVAYKVVLSHVAPATDNVVLWMRTSTDGGASYDAGASDYNWANFVWTTAAASALTGDAADNEMQLTGNSGQGNAANETLSGLVVLANPAAAQYAAVEWDLQAMTDAGVTFRSSGTGRRLTAANVDAIRFLFSSGNVSSGQFDLFGMAQ